MKDLQQIKDEVAIGQGYNKFPLFYTHETISESIIDQVAIRYAQDQKRELVVMLDKRISELNIADAEFCKMRWDMKQPAYIREIYRGESNSVTFARQELEKIKQLITKHKQS